MNKLTKGAIAGAAGIALLLGGAGSFALWNGNTSVNASQIQSGTLTIAANGTGTWQNTPNGGSAGAVTIATFRAVPGDTLTFTQQLNISAIGDNLSAALTVDPASIVASATNPTASAALKAALLAGMQVVVTTPPTGITLAASPANTYTVTGATGAKTITVTVTLPFPRGTAGDNTTQTGAVDLTGLKFTLTQN
ncbi:alternate-type signal peptide domain-containing protein [Diaminobutyricibacter sp. McL0618]|uniref:alternate-type signal peptide domain-containing protein n=1 Tax=Leifsonia sp. McL0618 TaxID=3415677 RepID=UPI003CE9AD17